MADRPRPIPTADGAEARGATHDRFRIGDVSAGDHRGSALAGTVPVSARFAVARIATAYLAHTPVPIERVSAVVRTIAETIAALDEPPATTVDKPAPGLDKRAFAVGHSVRLAPHGRTNLGPPTDPKRRGVITRISQKHLYVRWDGTRSEAIMPPDRLEHASILAPPESKP